ncbi:MAG: MFS transporter [Propionibacteriaceae bacterium]
MLSVVRRARWGVSLLFLTNAVVYASVVPRFPQLKADLGLSNTVLGLVIAAGPLGALLAGLVATQVVGRLGSARTGVVASALMSVNLLSIGFAPNAWWLGAGLFVAGFCDSVGDVGNNVHGLRVQRGYGRSIINSFHGIWSVGAVAGGVLGSAAAGLHVSVATQLTATAAAFLMVSLAASRLQLPGPDPTDRRPEDTAAGRLRASGSTLRALATLGALAALAGVVEDSGASWGAVYLSGSLGAGPGLAGSAFLTMAICMAVGRLTGDRLVDRYGERQVAATGAVLAAVALGASLIWPSTASVLVGFGLAGLGTATMIPAAMHAADHLPGLPPGAAITVVSLVSRLGFLFSPPLVGVIADHSSLRFALATVPVAALAALVCSRALSNAAIAQSSAEPTPVTHPDER